MKTPPPRLFADWAPTIGRANYLRFRVSPGSAIALAARVKRAGNDFVGDQQELYLLEEQPNEETPYELLLGGAMAGDGALFTRENAVEAAWAVEAALSTVSGAITPKTADKAGRWWWRRVLHGVKGGFRVSVSSGADWPRR